MRLYIGNPALPSTRMSQANMEMSEKKKLEKHTCKHFLDYYNQHHGADLKIIGHRDKPDFVVKDSNSNQIVGLEGTLLFYDQDEAKILLGRSDKRGLDNMSSMQLIKQLNALLLKKAESSRNYDFKNKMFLIIRVASRIFFKSSFDRYEEDIIIPPNLFDQIWLVFYNPGRQAWSDFKRVK